MWPYKDKATSTLPSEIDPKSIRKMHLAKFGNMYLLPEKELRTNRELMLKKLVECLDSSPLVTSTKRVALQHQPKDLVYSERLTVEEPCDILEGISFTPYILCNIRYPVKNQKDVEIAESFASASNIDTTDEFNLIYNGSIYAVFREADPSKQIHPGAIDIREFLTEIFDKKGKLWKMKEVPPNPLREDVYFLFLAESKETIPLMGRSFLGKRPNHLYICLPETNLKRFEQFMALCMYDVGLTLDNYYDASSKHVDVEIKREQLELNQRSLKKTADEIQRLSFFDFYGHYKKTKKLERLVSQHFSSLVDYSLTCEYLEKRTADAKRLITQEGILRPLRKRLIDDIRHEETETESLTMCANYLNDLTQRSYTNKISILAVILTIIGSLGGSLVIDYLRSIL